MAKPLRLLLIEDDTTDTELLLHGGSPGRLQVAHWCRGDGQGPGWGFGGATWDLVVSDYVLPTLNGMDVLASGAAAPTRICRSSCCPGRWAKK